MKLWVLGSGSRGNAVLIEGDGTRVLVDVGFGPKTLAGRLKLAGIDPSSIDACLLTHDHLDHAGGAARAARRWGWAVFATGGTVRSVELEGARVTMLTPGVPIRINGLEVTPLAIPHDATEPVGYLAMALSTGARAGICYDVGHASDGVRALCQELDVLVLEANHDEGMLWAGPYPPWLCNRIACKTGHLSNKDAGALARDSVTRRTGHVVLAHLSEHNNAPDVAHRTVRSALRTSDFRGTLTISPQDVVVGPFLPRTSRGGASPMQLSLF